MCVCVKIQHREMILTQHHEQNLGSCLKPAFPTFRNGSCNHDFNTLHSVNSWSTERGKDGAKRQLRKTPPLVDFALGETKTGLDGETACCTSSRVLVWIPSPHVKAGYSHAHLQPQLWEARKRLISGAAGGLAKKGIEEVTSQNIPR